MQLLHTAGALVLLRSSFLCFVCLSLDGRLAPSIVRRACADLSLWIVCALSLCACLRHRVYVLAAVQIQLTWRRGRQRHYEEMGSSKLSAQGQEILTLHSQQSLPSSNVTYTAPQHDAGRCAKAQEGSDTHPHADVYAP